MHFHGDHPKFLSGGEILVLPISRSPDSASLCLSPSAGHPTPIAPLLKAKAKPQFERPVESLSTSLFSAFQGSNRGQFLALFSPSGCPVGRGSWAHVWPMFGRRFSGFQRSFLLSAWAGFQSSLFGFRHLAIKKGYFLVNSSTLPYPSPYIPPDPSLA
jgi:hypothetical protein